MALLFWSGAVIISFLSVVALYYHMLLYNQSKKQRVDKTQREKALQERRKRNIDSIVIIARAVLDDQVSLTEASIRIHTISQSMSLNENILQQLSVFGQLASATSHIPILDRWKVLSRKEKIAFDAEREKIESGFRDFAVFTANKIVNEDLLGVIVHTPTEQ